MSLIDDAKRIRELVEKHKMDLLNDEDFAELMDKLEKDWAEVERGLDGDGKNTQ